MTGGQPGKPFGCNWCRKGFKSPIDLGQHVKDLHERNTQSDLVKLRKEAKKSRKTLEKQAEALAKEVEAVEQKAAKTAALNKQTATLNKKVADLEKKAQELRREGTALQTSAVHQVTALPSVNAAQNTAKATATKNLKPAKNAKTATLPASTQSSKSKTTRNPAATEDKDTMAFQYPMALQHIPAFQCGICLKPFVSEAGFHAHMESKLAHRVTICPLCSQFRGLGEMDVFSHLTSGRCQKTHGLSKAQIHQKLESQLPHTALEVKVYDWAVQASPDNSETHVGQPHDPQVSAQVNKPPTEDPKIHCPFCELVFTVPAFFISHLTGPNHPQQIDHCAQPNCDKTFNSAIACFAHTASCGGNIKPSKGPLTPAPTPTRAAESPELEVPLQLHQSTDSSNMPRQPRRPHNAPSWVTAPTDHEKLTTYDHEKAANYNLDDDSSVSDIAPKSKDFACTLVHTETDNKKKTEQTASEQEIKPTKITPAQAQASREAYMRSIQQIRAHIAPTPMAKKPSSRNVSSMQTVPADNKGAIISSAPAISKGPTIPEAPTSAKGPALTRAPIAPKDPITSSRPIFTNGPVFGKYLAVDKVPTTSKQSKAQPSQDEIQQKTVNNLLDTPIEGDADEDLLSKIGALVPMTLPVVVPASNVSQSSNAEAAEVEQAGVTASPYATTAWKWAQESNKKQVEAKVEEARIQKEALDRTQAVEAALLAANLEKIKAMGAKKQV